jgi:hypothetical protein
MVFFFEAMTTSLNWKLSASDDGVEHVHFLFSCLEFCNLGFLVFVGDV